MGKVLGCDSLQECPGAKFWRYNINSMNTVGWNGVESLLLLNNIQSEKK